LNTYGAQIVESSKPLTLGFIVKDISESIGTASAREMRIAAEAKYPEWISAHGQHLAARAIESSFLSAMRAASEEDHQLTLAGLYLPRRIPVFRNDETVYVPWEKACLSDLKASEQVRHANARAAVEKARLFEDTVRQLTPYMGNGETVQEALIQMTLPFMAPAASRRSGAAPSASASA
jgi:hypothetical protein